MSTEQEFKWHASNQGDFAKFKKALAEKRFKTTPDKVFIYDSYFDDDKGTLGAQKTALRLRSTDSNYEITVKEATQIKNGLAQRREQTLPLDVKSHTKAMGIFRSAFRKLWPDLNGPKQMFVIKNKREILLLESKNLTAEVAFDNCNIITPSKNIKFYEIEMELKDGSFKDFSDLAAFLTQKTGLKYSQRSKVATAVANL